ncbi:hypothetical protein [uncultured Tateyamaria sp.]|uniref:hypothetical protein n=1 Tax=uncultured Tateyamaria sp. TaxID=455651 RepID=UPI0026265D02|nr:hypothetical protein [uncultured Tateyamaria sp.]
MSRFVGIAVLCFGAVLINTLPIWVGVLGSYPALTKRMAGAFASLVLVSAALTCAGVGAAMLSRLARFLVVLALALIAFGQDAPAIVLAVGCVGLGGAIGHLTRQALGAIQASTEGLKAISTALSLGLVVSLLLYLLVPSLDASPLVLLLVLSLPLVLLPGDAVPSDLGNPAFTHMLALPLRYIGFFVMMGAYWTFLDLFGGRFNDADAVNLWLLGSLLSGACGSLLAARIPERLRPRMQIIGVLIAATTGAASYVAADLSIFGVTIIANGFALFMFFPLYLQGAGKQMPQAMAGYLLGFATGGAVGAVVIQMGGYQTLAVVILLSGLLGLNPARRRLVPK